MIDKIADQISIATVSAGGVVSGLVLAVSSQDLDGWGAFVEKVGILAVMIFGLGFLIYKIAPMVVDKLFAHYDRLEKRNDENQKAFLNAIEGHRIAIEKLSDTLDKRPCAAKQLHNEQR